MTKILYLISFVITWGPAILHLGVEIIEHGSGLASGGMIIICNIKREGIIAVDDLHSAGVIIDSLKRRTIGLMDMAVEHILGLPFLKKLIKTCKSLMRQILEISVALGGRMGH